jgi:hypothetical protein
MLVFTFNNRILTWCIRASNAQHNTTRCEVRVKFIIYKFSSIITLEGLNFGRKLSFNIMLKVDKGIQKSDLCFNGKNQLNLVQSSINTA